MGTTFTTSFNRKRFKAYSMQFLNKVLALRSLAVVLTGAVLSGCGILGSSQQASMLERAEMQNLRDSGSYAVGLQLAEEAREYAREFDANDTMLLKALQDALVDSTMQLSREEAERAFELYEEKRQEQERAGESAVEQNDEPTQAERNMERSKAFLKENIAKDGVKRTSTGLQYKVLRSGSGASPGASDRVKVHYRGKLIDGTVFDNSYKREKPATFGVNQVIKGWQEGLQRMKPGGKYRLFIPPRLAYGKGGAGEQIGPNQALIFTVELLEVVESGKKKE
jgi:FKBP-type peptidyl-prolyl cis-trans isomerase